MSILGIYLHEGLRQDAEAGRHNFFRILTAAFVQRGWRVVFHPDTPEERFASAGREGYSLFHKRDPLHDRALCVRVAWLYPFWRIEDSPDPDDWSLASARFEEAEIPREEADRFFAYWHKRHVGAVTPEGAGFVFAPLQGRLRERRALQSASPIDMLARTLQEEPDRPVLATLHPREEYDADDLAALDALVQTGRLRLSGAPMHALLAGCDHVVTENSSVAFHGLFHRKQAVLFAEADFHHILQSVPRKGATRAFEDARSARPDYAGYLWWYLQQGCINAGRPEAGDRIIARVRELGWDV
ncbi:MAG: hypothetical protein JJU40_00425 [Rhodobacteraceae bacterium]|nr:hypothetical protein [Paracoccaceae bacterium]